MYGHRRYIVPLFLVKYFITSVLLHFYMFKMVAYKTLKNRLKNQSNILKTAELLKRHAKLQLIFQSC